ncbi:MAG: hypothetical protein U0175_00525 [Caldilineaceae bacterium]
MTDASHEKWMQYEQALLVTMGFAPLPSDQATAIYQLLIIPTFHPPSCLRLLLATADGELRFTLLAKHASDLFAAIWRNPAQLDEKLIDLARQSCVEASAGLNSAQVARLRQKISSLAPMTFSDINLSARDGISIRCDCAAENRVHTFTLHSPTADEAPQQSSFVSLLIDAAQEHLQNRQIQEYIRSLRRYMH